MKTTTEYEDVNYSIGKGYSNVSTKQYQENGVTHNFFEGNIATHYGFVFVFSAPQPDSTTMHFIWSGRHYFRKWKYFFAPLTLSKLAKQFTKEIAEQA